MTKLSAQITTLVATDRSASSCEDGSIYSSGIKSWRRRAPEPLSGSAQVFLRFGAPVGLCGDRSMRGKRCGRSLVETDAPDEMSREIEARLGVRWRFYEHVRLALALVEVGT